MEKRDMLDEFVNAVDARARAVKDYRHIDKIELTYTNDLTLAINKLYMPMHSNLFGENSNVLSQDTRKRVISRGQWLDVHPEAVYTEGPLEDEPIIYLGDIREKVVKRVGGGDHTFLVTQSIHPTSQRSPFPRYAQNENREVITSGDVTFIDNRRKNIKNSEVNSLPKSLENINSEEGFRDLIEKGTANYQRIGQVTTIIPNETYEAEDGNFVFSGFWPYGKLNTRNEFLDVHVKPKGDEKTYVGTFITQEKIASLMEEGKTTGEYAFGTYLPPEGDNLIVRNLSSRAIDRTITDLLREDDFKKYFIELKE